MVPFNFQPPYFPPPSVMSTTSSTNGVAPTHIPSANVEPTPYTHAYSYISSSSLNERDTIILVVHTGSPSKFIETLGRQAGEKIPFSDDFALPITHATRIRSHRVFNSPFVFVDTRCFTQRSIQETINDYCQNDETESGQQTRRLCLWMRKMRKNNMAIVGIIFLHHLEKGEVLEYLPFVRRISTEFLEQHERGAERNIICVSWGRGQAEGSSDEEAFKAALLTFSTPPLAVAYFDGATKSAWDIVKMAARTHPRSFVKFFTSNCHDLVIPVLGPTGVGKSSFINNALIAESDKYDSSTLMEVGYSLTSCTKVVQAVILPNTKGPNGERVVLVDTPGFDDTYEQDRVILGRIAEWFKKSYARPQDVLGGVIYLHDISQDRMTLSARKSLDIFRALCGDTVLAKSMIATTKWDKVAQDIGEHRLKELRERHWRRELEEGVREHPYNGTPESAQELITHALNWRWDKDIFLEIQTELAWEDNKSFMQTKAGYQLMLHQLQEISLHLQSDANGAKSSSQVAQELRELRKEIKQFRQGSRGKDHLQAQIARKIRKLLQTVTNSFGQ